MNFKFFSNWLLVGQAIQGVQKNTKVQLKSINQIEKKSTRKLWPRRTMFENKISSRKIYKTPCKFMLVFRRNSVTAFKCQIKLNS